MLAPGNRVVELAHRGCTARARAPLTARPSVNLLGGFYGVLFSVLRFPFYFGPLLGGLWYPYSCIYVREVAEYVGIG